MRVFQIFGNELRFLSLRFFKKNLKSQRFFFMNVFGLKRAFESFKPFCHNKTFPKKNFDKKSVLEIHIFDVSGWEKRF